MKCIKTYPYTLTFHLFSVSSEEEFTDLVTEVLLILSDTSECNPMLFAKLLQLFVDFTICATSHICEGLRFAVTIQNIVLK